MPIRSKDAEKMRLLISEISSKFEKEDFGEKIEYGTVIPFINEGQYREMVLNETMHYPEFLNKLKNDIFYQLIPTIDKCCKESIVGQVKKENVTLHYQCKYFDTISFEIYCVKTDGEQWNDFRFYGGEYYGNTTSFENEKLINPTVKLMFTVGIKGETLEWHILSAVAHELTHVYDDWIDRINNKGEPISRIGMTSDEIKLLNSYSNTSVYNIFKWISSLLYLNSKTEVKAFITQTVSELDEKGCNLLNYKVVMYHTTAYNNYFRAYKGFKECLDYTDDTALKFANNVLLKMNVHFPKFGNNVFDANKYRKMLLKWADRIYHHFMKRYISVVYYYLHYMDNHDKIIPNML